MSICRPGCLSVAAHEETALSRTLVVVTLIVGIAAWPSAAAEDSTWEVTEAGEEAVERGLAWLARNQGKEGNWESKDLGLVSLGALAFLSAGHTPGVGKYGDNVRRALHYVLRNAKPSGLLNITGTSRDMYNHGLSTFVLTQAFGATKDKRVGKVLRKALKLIREAQCLDGGWDYKAVRHFRGHDLSLAVMQAKALRGAMDIGFDIPPGTVRMAIASVRGYYRPETSRPDGKGASYGNHPLAKYPGRFTYTGMGGTTAMAAAGAVCLQEFGEYDDFRIYRSMDAVVFDIRNRMPVRKGSLPFDSYTLYYVAQALFQVGGTRWRENYPLIRNALVKTQTRVPGGKGGDGAWSGGRIGGKPGLMFGTAVGVFSLSIPYRYLPILQPHGKEGPGRPGKKAASAAGARPRKSVEE